LLQNHDAVFVDALRIETGSGKESLE